MDASLDDALPPAPEGWTRHVSSSAREVEYRLTIGRAARAKLTIRAAADGGFRLESKRGCRILSETTADSVETAAATARDALQRA
jgi:hypothetical protein